MPPPSVFSYLLTAAAVRESAAEARAPGADARCGAIKAKPAPSSLWADRVDAGVRPAKFMAR